MTKNKKQSDVLEDLKNKEDKKARKKELKKLVVYEAIMKPKYEEGLKLPCFIVPVLLGLGLLIASCSVNLNSDFERHDHNRLDRFISNAVSLDDAYRMASRPTKGNNKDVMIEPIVDEEGDTLMYFVNYEEGWKILSADKRTPAVIAESEVGHISMSTENEGLRVWLEITAADMKQIIHSDDSTLNFTAEQIMSHRSQWSDSFEKHNVRPDRGHGPIFYEGEWELVGTGTEEVYYDHEDHLVGAHWAQDEPYNYYCPPKDSGSGNKPVGCTPVACGEMLQFLCDRFNYNLTLSYNGLSANINDVELDYTDTLNNYATPALLRILGLELNAHYSDTSTVVYNSLTKIKNFYSQVGISCTKQAYSADKVTQNLWNGWPVLVSAHSSSSGHTFIIDGYKKTRTMYVEYYQRLSGNPPLLEERTDTIGYSSPHIYQIKMNWGWWTQWHPWFGYDDDWFALTANWSTQSSGATYNQNVTILCDYSFAF